MPGLLITTTPAERRPWRLLLSSERCRFEPLSVPGLCAGRVDNGLLNPGPAASGAALDVQLDGELLYREELWAHFGGEPQELPERDQELLLALLQAGHDLGDVLRVAEGSFFVLVHERDAGRLLLASDRFGSKPHYWAHSGTRFVLAPELKACLAQPWVEAELDERSLVEALNLQCVLEERTLFEGVYSFPAGTLACLELSAGRLTLGLYGDWSDLLLEPFAGSFEEAVEEGAALFQRHLAACTRGPLRHGVYLSGGLDSRQILAGLAETRGVPTVSFGPAGSPDVLYAAACARAARTSHRQLDMPSGAWLRQLARLHTDLGEGIHCLFHSHNLLGAEAVGEALEVNLHGHFGDLLMGGGYLPEEGWSGDWQQRLLDTYQQQWGGAFPDREDFRAACAPHLLPALEGLEQRFRASCAPFAHLPAEAASDLGALQLHGRKQTQQYMVHNRPWFEARTPFLGLDLLGFLWSLPAAYRRGRRLQLAVLERLSPALARVPWARTQAPAVPGPRDLVRHRLRSRLDRLVLAPLTGRRRLTAWEPVFNHKYAHWVDEDLRPWIADLVTGADAVVAGYFRSGFLRRTLTGHGGRVPEDLPATWILGQALTLELLAQSVAGWRQGEGRLHVEPTPWEAAAREGVA